MSALERGLREFIIAETQRLEHFIVNLHDMPEPLRPVVALHVTSYLTAYNAIEAQIDRLTHDNLTIQSRPSPRD